MQQLPNVLNAMQSIRLVSEEVLETLSQFQGSSNGVSAELVLCIDTLKTIYEVSNGWIEKLPEKARRLGDPS